VLPSYRPDWNRFKLQNSGLNNIKAIHLLFLLSTGLSLIAGCGEPGGTVPGRPVREQTAGPTPAPLAESRRPGPLRRLGDEIADAVDRVLPAVVVVRTEAVRYQLTRDSWWGGLYSIPRRLAGQGSGVIVTSEGHVLTCHHVIAEAEEIEVVLSDGTLYPARLIGNDPASDLAVLKIAGEGEAFTPIEAADSDRVRVGEFAVAIGSPFALSGSVTLGIVSQKGRSVGLLPYEDFIQTDASINVGNSGGPLVDIEGRMIGINNAITTAGPLARGNLGIGFAVPSNLAMEVARALIAEGSYRRPRLGVLLGKLNPGAAYRLLGRERGVWIDSVLEGSPAEEAGLQGGDVIVALDGERVETILEVQQAVIRRGFADPIEVTVLRRGREETITVRAGR